MSDIFNEDKDLEAAMIKACLLFDAVKVQKREMLFHKKILVYILDPSKKTGSVDEIFQLVSKELSGFSFNRDLVNNAVNALKADEFIDVDKDGGVSLTEKTQAKSDQYISQQKSLFDKLVDSIFLDVKQQVPIKNELQVKQNIKNCIDYYIRVSCYKTLGVDEGKDLDEIALLQTKAVFHLGDNKRLKEQILLSIGNVIAHPTEEQHTTLDTMARSLITMQLLASDPLLTNFKHSVIGRKVFVLDTDFVLYLITDNGERSVQYKRLLKVLTNCNCKIYIPIEVLTEIFDHAEAATKKYNFVRSFIENGKEQWVENGIKNIFVEAYYKNRNANGEKSWHVFISNYYDKERGCKYTIDVVKECLSGYKNIFIGSMPYDNDIYDSDKEEDISLRNQLFEKALEATHNTEKAGRRDEIKNETIARTDTKLYLSVRDLNIKERERNGNKDERADLLEYKYYVITNTFRIYPCAAELNLKEKVFCTPMAMMAYMVEAGFYDENKPDVLSLFENTFFAYIANESWDDTKNILKTGIDFNGKSIVRLRYDLQDNIQKLLTAVPGSDDYKTNVSEVKNKGYSFVEPIEYTHNLEKQNADKDNRIAQLEAEINRLKKEKGKEKYQNRLSNKTKKGKKR